MAVEFEIKPEMDLKDVQAKLKSLNSTLEEQKEITILLQREQQKLEKELEGKKSLAGQKKVRDELNKVKDSLKDQALSVKELTLQKSKQKKIEKELIADTKDLNDLTKNLTNKLDQMTGGAITGFKGIVSGAKTGAKAMFTLRGAIISTQIGALVILVGSLIAYFTQTQEGSEKIAKIFGVIGTITQVLIDRLATLGKGLMQLFTGDFSGAADTFMSAFVGIGDEIEREIRLTKDLEDAHAALEKRRINFIVTEKKILAEIEASRLASEDFNTSIQARNAANQKAMELTKQLADEQISIKKEELRIAELRNGMGDTLNEDLEKQKGLEAEIFSLQQQRDTRLKEMVGKSRTLNAELQKQLELEKAIKMQGQMEQIEPRGSTALTPTQEIEVMQNELLNKKLAEQNERFAKERAEKEKADALERIQMEKLVADAKMQIEANVFNIATQLAGKNQKAQKAIAVADATINTYRGASLALGTVPPPVGQILAGTIIASGLLNVKKILSTNTGAAPSFSSGTSTSGGGETRQLEQPRVPNFDFMNQGVGGQQNAGFNPRAYVVNQDISDKQALSSKIKDLARTN